MRHAPRIHTTRIALAAAALCGLSGHAMADIVTDWNQTAGAIVTEAKLGTPPANRVMAIVQTAVYEAAKGVTRRYHQAGDPVRPMASVDAAVAAANHGTLSKLLPQQQASIDAAYSLALARIGDGWAKTAGIAAGQAAAAAVLAARANDGAATPETYRPSARPGAYVPTVLPAVPQWPQRRPWLMQAASQFRPGPPPAMTSESWARDYNEIRAFGGKNSSQRSTEQTEIARFWEYSLPPIYSGVVRSVADRPGRSVTRNARLYAAATQAMDDALIAVFDAKYRYNFWRPVTAIRNGDLDRNSATERETSWTPFIETPMHPEYPSAHSAVAGAVGAVLAAEVGNGPMPELVTSSPTAQGATRRWSSVADFTQEVSAARIYDGVHYRFSTEVGLSMGKQIGELAAARVLRVFD